MKARGVSEGGVCGVCVGRKKDKREKKKPKRKKGRKTPDLFKSKSVLDLFYIGNGPRDWGQRSQKRYFCRKCHFL